MNRKTDQELIEEQRYEARFSIDPSPRLMIDGIIFQDEVFDDAPPQTVKEEIEEIENLGESGICTQCKEHTEVGNSCCGDEYVHIY